MMTRTAIAAVVTAAALSLGSSKAQAASFSHIDRLARVLEGQSKQLASEFRVHYRHTPEYFHLISDTERVKELAEHVHEVVHHSRSISHLERDLRKLSSAFHHMEELVDDIERHARHGHGHVHGRTGHVRELLNSMDETLHHLQEDVEELAHDLHYHGHGHRRHYVSPRPTIGVGPHGVYIGGARFGIRIGH